MAKAGTQPKTCHRLPLSQLVDRPSSWEAMNTNERASTGSPTSSSRHRERPAAPFVAKGAVTQGQQPVGHCHVRELRSIRLASPHPVEELAKTDVLEGMHARGFDQHTADPARTLFGDVAQMSMLAAGVLSRGKASP